MLYAFIGSFLVSLCLQWITGRLWLGLLVPPLGFAGWVLLGQWLQPSALWPIALWAGLPITLMGATLGLIGQSLHKPKPKSFMSAAKVNAAKE